ncbi:unnamed protein product, partial [Schistosoma haematobium]
MNINVSSICNETLLWSRVVDLADLKYERCNRHLAKTNTSPLHPVHLTPALDDRLKQLLLLLAGNVVHGTTFETAHLINIDARSVRLLVIGMVF